MSPIARISGSTPSSQPVVSTPSKAKAEPAAPAAASSPAAATPQASPAVAAPQAANVAPAPVISYRNSFGDTVSITGIVLKDRDGDGGVGLPAPKAEAR